MPGPGQERPARGDPGPDREALTDRPQDRLVGGGEGDDHPRGAEDQPGLTVQALRALLVGQLRPIQFAFDHVQRRVPVGRVRSGDHLTGSRT